jgi:hypothetical protein
MLPGMAARGKSGIAHKVDRNYTRVAGVCRIDVVLPTQATETWLCHETDICV